jgi:hypothetical protein
VTGRRRTTRFASAAALALAAVFALAFAIVEGCSSSSALLDGGGCQAFCTKWVAARCPRGPTLEDCLRRCDASGGRCSIEEAAFFRCALLEGQIACETGTGEPRVVGCAPRETAALACQRCAELCDRVAKPACADGPNPEECVPTCRDRRCAAAYDFFASSCAWAYERGCALGVRGQAAACNQSVDLVDSCSRANGGAFFQPLSR